MNSVSELVTKGLGEDQIVLLMVPAMRYNKIMLKLAADLSAKKICYITLNKTYDSLKEKFQDEKISMQNFIFIDAVSMTIKDVPPHTANCYFVKSPSDLQAFSSAVASCLEMGFEYLIFDSLSDFFVHLSEEDAYNFIVDLVGDIRIKKSLKGIFCVMTTGEESIPSIFENIIKIPDSGTEI